MFYNAKNQTVTLGDTELDFVSFGTGTKNLVMIPGLGDGLKTVKGTAVPFALLYRMFAKQYKVYMFNRKNQLEQEYTTREMAADQAAAMKKLGIEKACVMGISQGGMIAQYLAADYSQMVEKLVLAVTLCRPNETVQAVVGNWLKLAQVQDFKGIFIDTAEKTYSEKKLKTYRPLYPALSLFGKPKSLERFLIQANACIHHDASDVIGKIECPTLVIGGDEDKIVGKDAAQEVARRIPDSTLVIYNGLGHGAYEEADDFNSLVLSFFE